MGKLFKFRRMQINEEKEHTHANITSFFVSLIAQALRIFYIFIKEFRFVSFFLLAFFFIYILVHFKCQSELYGSLENWRELYCFAVSAPMLRRLELHTNRNLLK